ncbi:MAG: 3-methylornithine--L-lysine ligase PylC, partial [bacterium]|nr:3-methylornithine--L-lysine ligase PylC [bacterium]
MKVIIVGGKLQGVEAAYLARKAGWEVMVIDKDPAVPASGLSDVFIQKNAGDTGWMNTLLKDAELVIPAVENDELLAGLDKWCSETGIPFAFDIDAYAVSSSKLKSNRLFAQIGIPAPVPWPGCGFPVVAKPSEGSGSEGVRIFQDRRQLEEYFSQGIPAGGWVLQEYV